MIIYVVRRGDQTANLFNVCVLTGGFGSQQIISPTAHARGDQFQFCDPGYAPTGLRGAIRRIANEAAR